MKRIVCILLFVISYSYGMADGINHVMGKITPLRAFDVLHYNISVRLDPETKSISGHNVITFRNPNTKLSRIQLDFAEGMIVDSISCNNRPLKFIHKDHIILVDLGKDLLLSPKSIWKVKVSFRGQPHIAENAPWKGGFVWSKDSLGYDWIGLACESIGASVWLPCKDHWSDEADSMDMHLTVPETLTGVSNGRLVGMSEAPGGYRTFHWKVINPINNYNIAINAGRYTHISDTFFSKSNAGKALTLDYYVLEYNRDRASQQFRQVNTMLESFEHYFGPYPFYSDGYKLVETPYLGMEHQSCIAYGNKYRNTPYHFDFIIIHESGHEWFANSITANDPADMWIHESFTTYSEALFLEYWYNMDTVISYLQMQKKKIVGKEAMQGPRDVYYHGRTDSDIYYKGTWVLHSMRNMLNNDSLWFSALKGFCTTYRHKIISTRHVLSYFNRATKFNWTPFFSQFIYSSKIPELEYRTSQTKDGTFILEYKWKNVVKGFDMPVYVRNGDRLLKLLPTSKMKRISLNSAEFSIDTTKFLFRTAVYAMRS